MIKQSLFVLMIMAFTSIAQTPQHVFFTNNPAQPTTADTIRFQLFDSNGCCCATYLYDSVLSALFVKDTTILLFFKADYNPCNLCDCALLGRWLPYKTAPLNAGVYGIYGLRDPCYPPIPCPDTGVVPVRIGQITVRASSGVIKTSNLHNRSIILKGNSSAIRFNARGEMIRSIKTDNSNAKGVFFIKESAGKTVAREAVIK